MGRHRKDQTTDPLNLRMAELRDAGMTLEQIGEIYGVTRERVRQRLSYLGLTAKDSGRTKSVAQRKESRIVGVHARRDERCMRVYGCPYAALEAILGAEVKLTPNRTARAFVQHKSNADFRGIEFDLTFPQWWAVWQKSGKWEQRGRGTGYVMARTGDVGCYSVGNVYICTQSQNSKDSYIKTPASVRSAKRAANPNARGNLGTGKGFTILRNCKTRPYQVTCGGDMIGYFATEEEARSAYLKACDAKRRNAMEVLSEAA